LSCIAIKQVNQQKAIALIDDIITALGGEFVTLWKQFEEVKR